MMFLKDIFQGTVVNDDQKTNSRYHKNRNVKTCKKLVVTILILTGSFTTIESWGDLIKHCRCLEGADGSVKAVSCAVLLLEKVRVKRAEFNDPEKQVQEYDANNGPNVILRRQVSQ